MKFSWFDAGCSCVVYGFPFSLAKFVPPRLLCAVLVQIDCRAESSEIELIVMECGATFDDVNFYFGGDTFALTVGDPLPAAGSDLDLATFLPASTESFRVPRPLECPSPIFVVIKTLWPSHANAGYPCVKEIPFVFWHLCIATALAWFSLKGGLSPSGKTGCHVVSFRYGCFCVRFGAKILFFSPIRLEEKTALPFCSTVLRHLLRRAYCVTSSSTRRSWSRRAVWRV